MAGLIREKEQQSAINAVGEKLEERRVWEGEGFSKLMRCGEHWCTDIYFGGQELENYQC